MPGAVLSVWKPDADVSGQLHAYNTGVERMRLGNHIKPKPESEQQFGDFSDDMRRAIVFLWCSNFEYAGNLHAHLGCFERL